MKIIIYPENSFSASEIKDINEIISFAESLLKRNKINIPNKIYFYNNLQKFIYKILPEVENYGFDEETSKEIIKCALNNGTYGTINFKEEAIVEMNFNPFKLGRYSSIDFLELIIHESLHLHLSKKIDKDINLLKFKFNKEKFIGNQKIIQFDEGYAEFMTQKILKDIDLTKVINKKITSKIKQKPEYKQEIHELKIETFDKNFENLLLSNRKEGTSLFEKNFNKHSDNKEILAFAIKKLKGVL